MEPDEGKGKFACTYHTHISLHLFPDKKTETLEGWGRGGMLLRLINNFARAAARDDEQDKGEEVSIAARDEEDS